MEISVDTDCAGATIQRDASPDQLVSSSQRRLDRPPKLDSHINSDNPPPLVLQISAAQLYLKLMCVQIDNRISTSPFE